jgi:hypothetical protein
MNKIPLDIIGLLQFAVSILLAGCGIAEIPDEHDAGQTQTKWL